MKESFYILSQTRERFISLLDNFSEKQLNHIPEGWNNNLIWNFTHTIVTQQLLCYNLSRLSMRVEDNIITAYRKGSKPKKYVAQEEITSFKNLASETLEHFKTDYEQGTFKSFQFYTTSFGVQLSNIEEAIIFNNTHEALHLGYAMSLAKKV